MQTSYQDHIIATLGKKITNLKTILEETIEKHSDAEYDLKDLKLELEELIIDKTSHSSEKMLVMATEWEDLE